MFFDVDSTPRLYRYLVAYYCSRSFKKAGSLRSIFFFNNKLYINVIAYSDVKHVSFRFALVFAVRRHKW